MSNPFYSIVIANYNYGATLSAAIESIISQDDKDYEIIIVDGGSSDNSVDIIKQYQQYLSWWISEPDSGQSNAFNKGFAKAKGEFITWLNADDIMLPGTLSAVKQKLKNNPHADWATGNHVRFLETDKTIISSKWGPHYLPTWMQGGKWTNVIFGPTTFWRRSVYEKLGPIDESLHYTMDTEYWARLSMNGYKQVRVNHYCWAFRMHPQSKTAEYGEHKLTSDVKSIIDAEHEYIKEKTGYAPTKLLYYILLFLRLIDGSFFRYLWNKKKIEGKNIKKYFHIEYTI